MRSVQESITLKIRWPLSLKKIPRALQHLFRTNTANKMVWTNLRLRPDASLFLETLGGRFFLGIAIRLHASDGDSHRRHNFSECILKTSVSNSSERGLLGTEIVEHFRSCFTASSLPFSRLTIYIGHIFVGIFHRGNVKPVIPDYYLGISR